MYRYAGPPHFLSNLGGFTDNLRIERQTFLIDGLEEVSDFGQMNKSYGKVPINVKDPAHKDTVEI